MSYRKASRKVTPGQNRDDKLREPGPEHSAMLFSYRGFSIVESELLRLRTFLRKILLFYKQDVTEILEGKQEMRKIWISMIRKKC